MSRTRTFALFVPVVIVMVVLDRLAKLWAEASLSAHAHEMSLGLVDFTLVHNTGAAFGMGQGQGVVFVVLALVVTAAVVAWLFVSRQRTAFEVLGLALVVAGGIGNCIDRVTTGYVVDFINFTWFSFPVFNVADICVTCGVAIFAIALVAHEVTASKGEGREDAR